MNTARVLEEYGMRGQRKARGSVILSSGGKALGTKGDVNRTVLMRFHMCLNL